ncbi:hypothetical protein [Conexibacter sp. SYSU D00693]|uniref:hypothetical protein n=1 Tax=Conexibacter sp. SYSU D00693 TaxID=2812560 RepID=UPI00196A62CC|nr:hypothetical protein [Conexibacter sp. SYSU D00693]
MGDAGPLLAFCELEFTHALGPAPGRYLVGTTADGADVLAVDVLGAPVPALLPRRRRAVREGRGGEERAPEPVALAVVRLVKASAPLATPEAGRALAEVWRGAFEERERWVAEALTVLNRAVAAFRVAAQNPFVVEVARADARAVRLGWGTADEVQRGGAAELLEVLPPRRGTLPPAQRLAPDEAVAAVLGGRASFGEAHDLLLRALLDLGHDRPSAAVLGLRGAADLALARARDLGLPELTDRLVLLGADAGALAAGALAPAPPEDLVARASRLADELGVVLDRLRAAELEPAAVAPSRG